MVTNPASVAPEAAATPSKGTASAPTRGYVWYAIGLLTTVNFFNFMDRMALSVLMPSIKADLRLSDAELGLLAGVAFALVYAISAIPIARIADRSVRKNIIAIAIGFWSAMTILCGLASNFWQLFLARVGVGGGEAGASPPSVSIMCDYVPFERRPGAFAVHSFGLTLGSTLGLAITGFLADAVGWRWTFMILGSAGLPFAILVWFTLREPVRGCQDRVESSSPMSFKETIAFLLQCKSYLLIVTMALLNGIISGIIQWWPTLYTRVFGLGISSAGASVGLAVGSGTALGLIIGGLLANKASTGGVQKPFMISIIAVLLAMPSAFFLLLVSDVRASLIGLAFWHFFTAVPMGLTAATVNSVVPARARATAYSIFIVSVTAVGGIGPVLVGLISDSLSGHFGVDALRYALMLPPCLLPVMAVALWGTGRCLPADLEAIGVKFNKA